MSDQNFDPSRDDLYIDIDGVLFGIYDGHLQIRPNVLGFLAKCSERYNCYWLTVWPEPAIEALMGAIYGLHVTRHIRYRSWNNNKTEGVDFARPFRWIEDGLVTEEIAILEDRGMLDRYIHVHYIGRDELERVWEALAG